MIMQTQQQAAAKAPQRTSLQPHRPGMGWHYVWRYDPPIEHLMHTQDGTPYYWREDGETSEGCIVWLADNFTIRKLGATAREIYQAYRQKDGEQFEDDWLANPVPQHAGPLIMPSRYRIFRKLNELDRRAGCICNGGLPMRIRSVCVLVAAIAHASLAASTIQLVAGGQATSSIVIPDTASEQIKEAARLMATCIAESTGVTVPVVAESKADTTKPCVHVGKTAMAAKASEHLEGLDGDGFVLLPLDANNLVIVGPTDWGTEFGVYEFLETRVGVRWLLPGPNGTYVPRLSEVTGPVKTLRQEPAAFSRLFSGLSGEAQSQWARRNRMHSRIEFHHNLLHLFPPETYTRTHPEFFLIHDGKRYLPPDNNAHGWQPCFSAPGIVEEAVKNIKAYFAKHPQETSYSLGVNDSAGHCQCTQCQAKDSGNLNTIGIRDVSDCYFEWCNAVVTQVLKEYPDKWFGCLAYSQVFEPPSRVKVHPRIIPYITYDRLKWVRPEQNAEGHEVTERWHRTSPVIAWYEYIYGTPYLLPRVYFRQMAENYRYASEHGVRAHYAEAYPNFGEGPKLYLSLKLQWNPTQDADALLRDWYVACVGAEADEDLAAYYSIWEAFWTGPALRCGWYTAKGEYLNFSSPAYLEVVDLERIKQSRSLLEKVVGKTKTEDQRARARSLLRAFEYYEASAYAYAGGKEARTNVISGEQAALDFLSKAGNTLGASLRRKHLVESFRDDPLLCHPLPPDQYGLLSGNTWGVGDFWQVYDWLDKSQAVLHRVEEMSRSDDVDLARTAKTMLQMRAGKLSPVCPNPGFEEGNGLTAAGWSYWVASGGRLSRVKDVKHCGDWSIMAEDFQRGGPHRSIPVTPGRYFGLCYVYVPKDQAPSGTVELSIIMRGKRDINLDSAATQIQPPPGQWTPVAVQLDVTGRSKDEEVTQVLFCPILNGFKKGDRVYIDDCQLYRLED
jgi:hypothetical protein